MGANWHFGEYGTPSVKLYSAVRGWVDRQWRAPGMQFKVLLLPAALPFLAFLPIDLSNAILLTIAWSWFGLWNSFVFWRYWVYMKEVSREADQKYDRAGRLRLAKEYHDTESATAATDRKRRNRKA